MPQSERCNHKLSYHSNPPPIKDVGLQRAKYMDTLFVGIYHSTAVHNMSHLYLHVTVAVQPIGSRLDFSFARGSDA